MFVFVSVGGYSFKPEEDNELIYSLLNWDYENRWTVRCASLHAKTSTREQELINHEIYHLEPDVYASSTRIETSILYLSSTFLWKAS